MNGLPERPGKQRLRAAPALLRLARPHQWVKNLLLLVPLATAHRLADPAAVFASLQGLVAACLAASAVYAFNDLVDVEIDRAHPTKRTRPIASGELDRRVALPFAMVLAGASLLAAYRLPAGFLPILLLYLAGATAYTLWLKRIVCVDVAALAGLYVLRVQLGAAAIAVPASRWLLAFAGFLFLSLALLKRYVEIDGARRSGRDLGRGRGYALAHHTAVGRAGMASGLAAVAVLAFYAQSHEASLYYAKPVLLWGLVPLTAFWIDRVWRCARRGDMHDDPIVFALRDGLSYAVVVAMGALMFLAA